MSVPSMVKTGGGVSLFGSTFEKMVTADGMTIGGDLDLRGSLEMQQGATFKGDVVLSSVKTGGVVSLDGSVFEKMVTAEGMTVGDDLDMRRAMFKGNVSYLVG